MNSPNSPTLSPTPASLYVAWGTSLLASAASVYFIEILHHPAATLCWVNRMLMFGLFLVLSVGIWTRDRRVWRYTLPFLAIGTPLAIYQQLVHWDIIRLAPTACSLSYVCTTKFFNLFGFISQATLCLAAFVTIGLCVALSRRALSE